MNYRICYQCKHWDSDTGWCSVQHATKNRNDSCPSIDMIPCCASCKNWDPNPDHPGKGNCAIYKGLSSGDDICKAGHYAKKYSSSSSSSSSSSGGCYVATCVYGSYDCPQVWTLRRYRDNTLASTWYGRAFIRTYYAISPTLVKWFGNTQWFKTMWQGKLDSMVERLNREGVQNTPYEDRM